MLFLFFTSGGPYLSSVLIYVMLLVSMSFFTLLERKILGYCQLRKGPNKVGLNGILQPFADALKLFSKEMSGPIMINKFGFYLCPVLTLLLALSVWLVYPSSSAVFFLSFSVLFFICVSSLGVYCVLGAGWCSNSKYSLLGSLRGVAQTVSYEVSMVLILLSAVLSFSVLEFSHMHMNSNSFLVLGIFPFMVFWFTSSLAETNRTPFDFSEGESELVSGFNTEYSAGMFAFIFMGEYLNIIMMSLVTSVLFFCMFSGLFMGDFFMLMITFVFSVGFIWVRGSLPRIRYDWLMMLVWKKLLPFSLGGFMMIISMSVLL